MSTITTIQSTDQINNSRSVINTNFSNLNTDKAELSGATFTGDINVPDEAYWVGWNWSTEVPTKNALYDKIETLWSGSVATDSIWDAKGDLAVGTGANTASRLAVGTNGQVLTADSAEATGMKWTTVSGTGDVVWPASSTDNAVARFDSTTWKLLQNSAVTIADTTGDITGGKYNTVAISGASTPALTVTGTTAVSGTNTGDQTSIVGITWTKAQFDTACTDGNFVYTGDNATSLNMSTARILWRSTASSWAVEEITIGSWLSLSAWTLSATGGGGSVNIFNTRSLL